MTWLASWPATTARIGLGRITVEGTDRPAGKAAFDTEDEAMAFADQLVQERGALTVVVWEIDGEACT